MQLGVTPVGGDKSAICGFREIIFPGTCIKVGKFPLRRMTEDGEVADVVAFFASDRAKAVTGQYLLVNSGEMFR